jgi:hypothetical protein
VVPSQTAQTDREGEAVHQIGGWVGVGGHLGWSCASARTDGPDDEGGEDGPKASVGSIWEYKVDNDASGRGTRGHIDALTLWSLSRSSRAARSRAHSLVRLCQRKQAINAGSTLEDIVRVWPGCLTG